MKIAKNTVVSVAYKLSDAQGNLIEESDEPMVYLHGGYDGTFPKIEEQLDGQEPGYQAQIQLEPQDAFGDYDPELVKIEPRDRFPEPLEVGMQFEGTPEDGDEEIDSLIYTVTDIAEDKVVLDGNHPLAGMALRFALTVRTCAKRRKTRSSTNMRMARKGSKSSMRTRTTTTKVTDQRVPCIEPGTAMSGASPGVAPDGAR